MCSELTSRGRNCGTGAQPGCRSGCVGEASGLRLGSSGKNMKRASGSLHTWGEREREGGIVSASFKPSFILHTPLATGPKTKWWCFCYWWWYLLCCLSPSPYSSSLHIVLHYCLLQHYCYYHIFCWFCKLHAFLSCLPFFLVLFFPNLINKHFVSCRPLLSIRIYSDLPV